MPVISASCGPFGYCDHTRVAPACQCIDGFEPIDALNSSRGCRRKEALECGQEDRFLTLSGMKIPDKFVHIRNRSFDQCQPECSRNCSCLAYAYTYSSNDGTMGDTDTSRCLLWTGVLLDMGKASVSPQTVRFFYNPSFSAYFFSRNSVFLSQQINWNNVLACFFSEANGALVPPA